MLAAGMLTVTYDVNQQPVVYIPEGFIALSNVIRQLSLCINLNCKA